MSRVSLTEWQISPAVAYLSAPIFTCTLLMYFGHFTIPFQERARFVKLVQFLLFVSWLHGSFFPWKRKVSAPVLKVHLPNKPFQLGFFKFWQNICWHDWKEHLEISKIARFESCTSYESDRYSCPKLRLEVMGAREGDTRGVRELPLPSRVFFSRARFFLCPLLPSACYAS